MKDCCKSDEQPGPIKRITNSLTAVVLALLALVALASVFFKLIQN